MKRTLFTLTVLAASWAALGCGKDDGNTPAPSPTTPVIPYDTLSEYGLFEGNGSTQIPVAGVIPYEPIAKLYSDYSSKRRFLQVPSGQTITYLNDLKWEFPAGTIIIKSFSYLADLRDVNSAERMIETRLLIKQPAGADETWTFHTYTWNDEQTEAFRTKAGVRVPVTWIDVNGTTQSLDYRVPNLNQCLSCHGDHGETELLGVRTRQLNQDYDFGAGPENIVDHLDGLGLFDVAPPAFGQRPRMSDPFGNGNIDARARSYLDANCAHCHNRDTGFAFSSGLFLDFDTSDPIEYGVCRTPTAAGGGAGQFTYDIVPGAPEESILVFRMQSTDPAAKMPEIPIQIPDADGLGVVSAWISGMSPAGCP